MRIFPPLVQAAQLALNKIFIEGRPADRAVEGILKNNRKLGSRDRRFVAETVYECVRWSRRLQAIAMDADVHREGWSDELLIYGILEEWEDFADLDEEDYERVAEAAQEVVNAPRAVRESIPDDIDEIGAIELGDAWDKELEALNETAPVDLRLNRNRATLKELRSRLNDEGIETDPVDGYPDALTLRERKNVFITNAYKEGLFEVQDRSSQMVAPFMKLEGASRVIDACAGAGGKTLHIASLMENRGRIISMDITDWKLKELDLRARRGKFSTIETRLIDTTKVIKRQEASADRVLLDVPCTGLGVLRRNPGSKLRLNRAEVERLWGLQAEILGSYSRMVKPGGYLIYATCSILPSENRGQVDKFLASPAGASFEFEEDWSQLPSRGNGDGFYVSRMKRKA
ncbi:MAG: methyltransferase domain-containing protein [Bdellovibrionaceae bacterium]|nr:methyltransferase domain-containing protein [Pseudobdellovibrionaceae bacterium]